MYMCPTYGFGYPGYASTTYSTTVTTGGVGVYPYSQCFQMILGGVCECVSSSYKFCHLGHLAYPPSPETRLWAIKEIVRNETGPALNGCAQHYILAYVKQWAESEDAAKAIMSVLSGRLDEAWPCNYKALDMLSSVPDGSLIDIISKLTGLTQRTGEEGKNLKALAEPLLKKAKGAKDKADAEAAKKREAAVQNIWGGLVNPAMMGVACPPALAIGCVGSPGINYYPHYLRPNLEWRVCPLSQCIPSRSPCVHITFNG
jgi:hypothetical protein